MVQYCYYTAIYLCISNICTLYLLIFSLKQCFCSLIRKAEFLSRYQPPNQSLSYYYIYTLYDHVIFSSLFTIAAYFIPPKNYKKRCPYANAAHSIHLFNS